MKRMGRRHRPFYRICVMDSRVPRDGKAIEEVGYYDPMVRSKSNRVNLDLERIDYWISVGAKPSEKVAVLINKVKADNFGEAKAPPPITPPKPEEKPEEEAPVEEASAEAEGGGEEAAAETEGDG